MIDALSEYIDLTEERAYKEFIDYLANEQKKEYREPGYDPALEKTGEPAAEALVIAATPTLDTLFHDLIVSTKEWSIAGMTRGKMGIPHLNMDDRQPYRYDRYTAGQKNDLVVTELKKYNTIILQRLQDLQVSIVEPATAIINISIAFKEGQAELVTSGGSSNALNSEIVVNGMRFKNYESMKAFVINKMIAIILLYKEYCKEVIVGFVKKLKEINAITEMDMDMNKVMQLINGVYSNVMFPINNDTLPKNQNNPNAEYYIFNKFLSSTQVEKATIADRKLQAEIGFKGMFTTPVSYAFDDMERGIYAQGRLPYLTTYSNFGKQFQALIATVGYVLYKFLTGNEIKLKEEPFTNFFKDEIEQNIGYANKITDKERPITLESALGIVVQEQVKRLLSI